MPPIRRIKGAVGKHGSSTRKIAGRGTPRPSAPDATPEVPDDENPAPAEPAGEPDAVADSADGDDAAAPTDATETDAPTETDDSAETDADPADAEDPADAGDEESTDAAGGSDDAESTDAEVGTDDAESTEDAGGTDDAKEDSDDEDSDDAVPTPTYSYDYGDDAEQEKSGSGSRLPKGRALAAAGIVIGLVAGAVGLFLATGPGLDTENEAFVDEAATEEVRSAATSGVQRLVAIDHENLDEYHATLDEYLAPHLVDELNETWDVLRDTYEQTQTAVDAQVREVGVSHLSDDRAEVLLVQDVSMTREGTAAGSTSGTYLVGMEKIDGVWKLSEIPDLPT